MPPTSVFRHVPRPRLVRTIGSPASLRLISVLSTNAHIKAFRLATLPPSYLLSYLDTSPPSAAASIGTATELPPTPRSFTANPRFLSVLNETLREHAHRDDGLKSQALAFAASGGSIFGAGTGSAATKGGSHQGGAGGGGLGGWVHLSDLRNPPDYGRIAWPEDILGSVEVDRTGGLLDSFQSSGTYRIVTNEGILGLSDFLREKLVERLREVDKEDTADRPQVLE
ncbi:hypothetical protein CMQ_3146 [Grosmannia clavigera kw1407]|uniref:Uncharacterized protein n=1 Tax=Grosmannia clavigera (strain kw1407 / UAMH 11150) TaxID=655863 RepID=F0XGQ9_GROCL|nr:uncharacterized protein CMQ_3146 [Grosmannia clavigera kw1407]EFX03217.1 hypothetical protein CMQ_3146 [Grosmannia clavigera kw1407]